MKVKGVWTLWSGTTCGIHSPIPGHSFPHCPGFKETMLFYHADSHMRLQLYGESLLKAEVSEWDVSKG